MEMRQEKRGGEEMGRGEGRGSLVPLTPSVHPSRCRPGGHTCLLMTTRTIIVLLCQHGQYPCPLS